MKLSRPILTSIALATLIATVPVAFAEDDALMTMRQTALEAGDVVAGETVFKKCRACHKVGEGAKNGVGPKLNGIVGVEIAAVEGFKYSNPFKAAAEEGVIWTPEALDAFLLKPRDFIAKTKMTFAGVKSEEDRANVIAYLAGIPADE